MNIETINEILYLETFKCKSFERFEMFLKQLLYFDKINQLEYDLLIESNKYNKFPSVKIYSN